MIFEFMLCFQKGAAYIEREAKVAGKNLAEYKSINDVRFITDSMLFGLGKHLRRCGFDTLLIADREKIMEYCTQEANRNVVVLSTGKGHKQVKRTQTISTCLPSIFTTDPFICHSSRSVQLHLQLPEHRVLNVPAATDGSTPHSLLVTHVLNQLNIILRPGDMCSRCVECNKRAFVRLPKRIVQCLFYMKVVRHSADWLEITVQVSVGKC